MKNKALAFDNSVSFRWYDDDGRMHVDRSNLTRVQVAPYRGAEIPDWREKGLSPTKIYYGYRSADELSDPETIKSVIGIPIQLNHHADTPDAPAMDTRVGSTGDQAEFDGTYLSNSLHIQNEDACKRIRDGSMRQLSLAYYYDPDFDSSGEFEGKHYDFTMRNIRGQHLALVEEGRAGRSCLVEDNALNLGEKAMNGNKKTPQGVAPENSEEKTELKVADAMSMLSDLLRSLHKQEGGEEPKDISEDSGKDAKIEQIAQSFAKLGADEGAVVELKKSLQELAYEPTAKDEGEGEQQEEGTPEGKSEREAEIQEKDTVDVDDEPIDKEDEEESTEDGEAEETDSDLDDLARDALKACGLDSESDDFKKAFAAGVHYGEKKGEEPSAKDDADEVMEIIEDEEDEDEEEDDPDNTEEKQIAEDAALEVERKWDAIEACRPILGNVRRTAYDSAEDVYIAALKQAGCSLKNVTKENAQMVLCGYLAGLSAKSNRGTAADTATADEKPTSGLADVVRCRVS